MSDIVICAFCLGLYNENKEILNFITKWKTILSSFCVKFSEFEWIPFDNFKQWLTKKTKC